MGTPHQGGIGAHLGDPMLRVTSIFATADDEILKHLKRDSEWLQQQLGQFGLISRDFVIKFAYEMYPTPVALGKTTIVSNLSLVGRHYELLTKFRWYRTPRQSFRVLQMRSSWR